MPIKIKKDGAWVEVGGHSGGGIVNDKIQEGDTSAEVVDTGSNGHFKVTIEGTQALEVDNNRHLLLKKVATNEGGHLQFENSVGNQDYGIDVFSADNTEANSVLRIIDEVTRTGPTGTTRYSINRSGALGLGHNDVVNYGTANQVLTSAGDGALPTWSNVPSQAGTTYTLPVFGTTNGGSGLRLTGSDATTDDVNITGSGGITVIGSGGDTLTIDGSGAAGKTYTFTSVADVTNVNLRLNDGSTTQDVLLTAGTGITLDSITAGGFTITANANAGKTYDLTASDGSVATEEKILLTGSDSSEDAVTLAVDSNSSLTIARSGNTITFSGAAAGGLTLDTTVTDILDLTGSTLSADDADADSIVFWDDNPGKLTYLTVGNGLAITGTEITATGDTNFSVPGSDKQVLFNDSTFLAAASKLEYSKGGDGILTKKDGYISCEKTGNDNYAHLSADGAVEIKRNDQTVNTTQGPYIDFITTASDYDARIQMDRTVGDNFSSIIFITGGEGATSEKLRIGKAGEIGIAGANYGTLGQVLTSGGDGASVTWESGTSATTVTVDDEGSTDWRDIVYSAGAGAGETLKCNDTQGAVNGLQVRGSDGAVRVKGDITAYRSSDITLKDNISPIKNALAKVSSISGNIFTWNEKSTDDKRGNDDTGVIAQEITALELPGVTTTRDDGTQAVMYEKLVPLLIEAIKELKEEVNELKSRS